MKPAQTPAEKRAEKIKKMPPEKRALLPKRINPIIANRRQWPVDLGIKAFKRASKNVSNKFKEAYKKKAWDVHAKEMGYADLEDTTTVPFNRAQARRFYKERGGFQKRTSMADVMKRTSISGTNHERHLARKSARNKLREKNNAKSSTTSGDGGTDV